MNGEGKWIRDVAGGSSIYYPEEGKGFAIYIDKRRVLMWGGPNYYDNRRTYTLPSHILTAEDAEAWAYAIWRLES